MMRLGGLLTFAFAVLTFVAPTFAAQDVIHHTATVKIDPQRAHLEIEDTISLLEGGDVTFTLSPAFHVDDIIVNGQSVPVHRDDDELSFSLTGSGPFEVRLNYQGRGAPLLAPEGGFVEATWLAQPTGALATWTIEGQTPPNQKFIVPGRLLSETHTAEAYTAQFENLVPSTLPVLITGPFEIAQKMLGDIRLRTYFHAELASLADGYLEDTARYITHYVEKIGPYPYPGFSIVSGPAPVGWGLPGMTYMGRRVLALPFIRDTSLPHEILHNWWGNAVEVDYATGNWAEGLTTYQADHAIAELRKPGGGQEKRLEWLRNYAALPPERDHPLSAFRSKTHDASQVVGYGKTAFVFHMLKIQLGADTFDKAIRRFAHDNVWKTAGWPDIQAAFEAESGQDLAAFFKTWVSRPGAPAVTLTNATADGNTVHFTLNQTQDGPSFALTLPINLETQRGPERHDVTLNTPTQSYTLAAHAPVKALRVDPESDVFRRLSPSETPPIVRDVTLNPATDLMAFGSPEMRDAAYALGRQLLQSPAHMSPSATTSIIVGAQPAVRQYLASNGLPPAPDPIKDRGDARAWTARTADGRTILVIEAEDVASLNGLARVLPHYKRRSYVVMENAQTIDKGTWSVDTSAPPTPGRLTVRFD
ncbi:M1 family metallopeptidase [Magnetovibrio sp.]|uniref:M1 family metallopeptidase n=1 Tax=Magnetovibrio sp. TaxID=2024836 RepID=UPI002F95E0AD